jgi:endonuclease G, mitochondrial
MKKLLVLLALLSTQAFAWDQRPPMPVAQCQVHSPYGFAQTARTAQPICREAYLVAYDAPVKIPVYVAYTLLPQNALGCFPRTNAFVADQSVPNGARPDDYAGTGYDKGHAAPDGDLSWSQQVEYESFLMTNMYPQHGSLNRGIWKLLETSVRGWAVQLNQSYTVYAGAIYGAGDPTIGNGVIVPHGYYKIVINNQTKEIAGWAFPHTKPYVNLGNDLTKFRLPIAQIETTAGVKYAYPAGAKELNPGQEWPVNFGALTNAKRAKCGKSDD